MKPPDTSWGCSPDRWERFSITICDGNFVNMQSGK